MLGHVLQMHKSSLTHGQSRPEVFVCLDVAECLSCHLFYNIGHHTLIHCQITAYMYEDQNLT